MSSIEHGNAETLARQSLNHRIDVTNTKQTTLYRHSNIVGGKLNKINPRAQALHFERVANGLVGWHSNIAAHVGDGLFACNYIAAQTCVVLINLWIECCGSVDVEACGSKTYLANIIERHHRHLARNTRQGYLATKRGVERR